jgi:hypothetical protein
MLFFFVKLMLVVIVVVWGIVHSCSSEIGFGAGQRYDLFWEKSMGDRRIVPTTYS